MLESQTRTRLPSHVEVSAPPAVDQVRRFLAESEQRVIVHCQKLLEDQSLPTEERSRLKLLIGEAEARLESLPV
jgi:hypothetical protein